MKESSADMPFLVNYQQKYDQAVRAYFDCKDKDQRAVIAFFIGIELENLKSSEAMLDRIINGDMDTLTKEYKQRHNALLKEMLKYLVDGTS